MPARSNATPGRPPRIARALMVLAAAAILAGCQEKPRPSEPPLPKTGTEAPSSSPGAGQGPTKGNGGGGEGEKGNLAY